MSTLAQLAQVPNLSHAAVIEKLVEYARDSQTGVQKTLPLTTFFLKSGLSLRGQVIALSDDAGPRTVVLLMQSAQDQAQDLGYVALSEIAGVAVHNAVNLIEHLSDGRITKPMTTAPSAAELHNLAKAVMDEINKTAEGKMTLEIQELGAQSTPEIQQGLYLGLRDLYTVLKKMAAEELGRRSLQELGLQFAIRFGEAATVQIKRNSCVITIANSPGGIERVSRESLRASLESAV